MQPKQFKLTFCRLCFSDISDTNCEIIGDVLKEVLEVVLPNLILEEGNEHVMCKKCLTKSYAIFNFKSTCMGTEDYIERCIDSSKVSLIDLKEVYLNLNGHTQITDILENQRICRLCVQLVTEGCVSLNEVDVDILNKCLPRVNIGATADPVICEPCFDLLRTYSNFLKNCLEAEEKYKDASKQSYIKTEKIEIKLENDQNAQEEYINIDNQTCIKSEEIEMKLEDQDAQCHYEFTDKQFDMSKVIEIKEEEDDQNGDCFFHNIPNKIVENKMRYTSDNIARVKDEDMLKHATQVQTNGSVSPLGIPSRDSVNEFNSDLNNEGASKTKKFKCEECEFETNYDKSFRCHKLLHKDPSELQMYQCDKCNYQTKYKHILKRHQIRHKDASEIKMFKCEACAYETKFKQNLKMHALSHKDHSETYKCDQCTFETIHKKHLASHQIKHKDPSQTQVYKCYTCAYETKHKSSLVTHQLVHKNVSETQMYKCGICNYETKHKGYLKFHQSTHKIPTEIQMYKCGICPYVTKHKQYIKNHQLVHKDRSEVQMYKCNTCCFETKYKKSIKNHVLKHEIFLTAQKEEECV